MKRFGKQSNLYYIWPLIISLILGSICGCSNTQAEAEQAVLAEGEEIELLDPVGVATNYDVAGYRDIYNASVSSCIVSPAVEEFDYTTDSPFSKSFMYSFAFRILLYLLSP